MCFGNEKLSKFEYQRTKILEAGASRACENIFHGGIRNELADPIYRSID